MIAGFERPDAGPHRHRRRRRDGDAAAPAAREHRLPELRVVPAPARRAERRLRPALQGRLEAGAARPRRQRRSSWSGSAGSRKRRPHQLSGGPAAAGRAGAGARAAPGVLLLDEPLGALDAKLRRELQVELKSIQREIGITFLYVTHDQEEALTMSDRLAVMATARSSSSAPRVRCTSDRRRRSWPTSSASPT